MMQRSVVLMCAAWIVIAGRAGADCTQPVLQGQVRDAATIRKLEAAWTHAFLTGDTDLETCLLSPDFTAIQRDGTLENLQAELALAAANKGKTTGPVDMPPITVLLHDDVAVAYATGPHTTMIDGEPHHSTYADFYVWKDGSWRVYFAQQTAFRVR